MRYSETYGRWKKPVLDSFLARIELIPFCTCWIWIATTGLPTNPYGVIIINGASVGAHRWSYSHYIGDIPDDLSVLHRCDEPLCVNPTHLFLGTRADNTADMRAKGRAVYLPPQPGPLNPNAMFTWDQITAIRADNRSQAKIAADYGCDQFTICNIKRGRTYKEVAAA